VWLLLKSLYGLVQSARQFFLKFRAILLQLNFVQSKAEPCLFTKRANDGSESFVSVMDYMMDKNQFEIREGVKSPSVT
jgi:hypothetical protein